MAVLVVGVPNFIKARSMRAAAPCINRLRQIESAKAQWALEQSKTTNDLPAWSDLFPYLASSFTNSYWTNGRPVCPEGGAYILGGLESCRRVLLASKTHNTMLCQSDHFNTALEPAPTAP